MKIPSFGLNFTPQGGGLSIKAVPAQEWHMVSFLECPAQGQQLDSVILLGPLQLNIFYRFHNS